MAKIKRQSMPKNPRLDIKSNINHSPHVIILGAGASISALPNGDHNGRKIPLMHNFVEVLGLDFIMARYGLKYAGENFEELYDKLISDGNHSELCNKFEEWIERYFQHMQLPDEPTIYDYLILSLRNKDLIATFNWDPFLSQAFNRNKDKIGYENLPNIAHLHGNVAIGICYQCKLWGWRYNQCIRCKKNFSPSKLLFPISKKDYAKDSFVFDEWKRLKYYIQNAYFLTIFGYSAPKSDYEAKKLLLEAWRKVVPEYQAMMSIIDIKSEKEPKKSWLNFIVEDDYMITNNFFDSYLARHPRRSCEAWAMASLQQSPWKENPFPQNISLTQLQDWTLQLIEEENVGKLDNKINDIKIL